MNLWMMILGPAAGSALATYVAIGSIARMSALHHRWCAVLGWLAVLLSASTIIWLLFRQSETAAAAAGASNVGSPILYSSLWLVSFLGSLLGLAAFLLRFHLKPE